MRLLLLLTTILLSSCQKETEGVALGTLERDRIAHTATVNEVIIALPIEKGALVTKGTVLVRLDSTQQNAQVAKVTADVAEAKANLDKLKRGARVEDIAAARAIVAGAKATLVESEANYRRTKNLATNDLTSQALLDQTLASRDFQLASLESSQEKLEVLIKGARSEDLQIAEARLNAAKAILDIEKKKLADLTIIATRDGILDNLPWNLGERVLVGSPVAVVLAGNAPFARIYVPEVYRVNLNVDDKLTIHVDGLEKTIVGSLRWISNEPAFSPYYALNQTERSRLMYLAEIQLPDDYTNLANGIPVQVEMK